MLKIGICDDQEILRNKLHEIVCECLSELKMEAEIYIYSSWKEVISDSKKLDLLFLDIEMPEMDGIETGHTLRKQGFDGKIIMASSVVERFKETFTIQAFRFVTKPVEKSEVLRVLEAYMNTRLGMKKIKVYRKRNEFVFQQKDILYINSINSAVEFHMKKGVFRKEISLSEIEEILDDRLFFRISKQYIVNLSKIDSYNKGIINIRGKDIKVSVRRKKEFEKKYVSFQIMFDTSM